VSTPEWFTTLTAQQERLTALYEKLRDEGRQLDAMELILARDIVELFQELTVAVRMHHVDTQHVVDKGVYRTSMADRMLYDAAGLDPILEPAARGSAPIEAQEGT
jgi:hypothetical protein